MLVSVPSSYIKNKACISTASTSTTQHLTPTQSRWLHSTSDDKENIYLFLIKAWTVPLTHLWTWEITALHVCPSSFKSPLVGWMEGRGEAASTCRGWVHLTPHGSASGPRHYRVETAVRAGFVVCRRAGRGPHRISSSPVPQTPPLPERMLKKSLSPIGPGSPSVSTYSWHTDGTLTAVGGRS